MTTPQEEQCEMSTRAGDDTDTVGNIEDFIRQCLEDMEPDHRRKGLGRPRILPAMALWGALLVCVLQRLWQPTVRVASCLRTRTVVLPPISGYGSGGLQAAPYCGDRAAGEALRAGQQRVGTAIEWCGIGEAGAVRQGGGVHKTRVHWTLWREGFPL